MSTPLPLHMVSSMAPPSQAEIRAASFTASDRRHEKELLRQISLGMQRKQKDKRRQEKRNNNKKAPRIETDILTNQQRPVRIVRTDPNASSRKVVQAQLQDYMPTDTLTPSTTRRGRLLALSKEEEGDISDSIQDLREVLRIRTELAHVNAEDNMEIMPSEQEWADACDLSVAELRRIITDGTEGRTRLVAANAGLVTSIAKRHYNILRRNTQGGGGIGTILTLHDLVQEGNLGLMEAAERFDPSKGFRFSTYASYWIRQRISRSIEDSSRVIRLPAHVHSMLGTIKKTEKEMEKEFGYSPSMGDVAGRLGMSEEKLKLYSDASRNVLSLEQGLNAKFDDRRTIMDKISSRSPTPADDAEIDSLRTEIRDAVEGLTERERDVLVARFGLDNARPPLSTSATAELLGISSDRVSKIQAQALHKLRHPNRNYRLKDFVGGTDVDSEEQALIFEQQQAKAQLQEMQAQARMHTPAAAHALANAEEETAENMWSF